MLIFAINLNISNEDKKIDQLKSPLINQNIPKKPIRLFQKNEIIELKNIYSNLYAINFFCFVVSSMQNRSSVYKIVIKKNTCFWSCF